MYILKKKGPTLFFKRPSVGLNLSLSPTAIRGAKIGGGARSSQGHMILNLTSKGLIWSSRSSVLWARFLGLKISYNP